MFSWVNHDSTSLHIITAWHTTSSPLFRLVFPIHKELFVSWMDMAYYFLLLLSSHWMSITTPEQIRAELCAYHCCLGNLHWHKDTVSWLGFSLSPSLKLNWIWKIHWNCKFILCPQDRSRLAFWVHQNAWFIKILSSLHDVKCYSCHCVSISWPWNYEGSSAL